MDPDQVFIVCIHRHDWIDICQVEIIVCFPQCLFIEVLFYIETFEVVEQRFEYMLVEDKEVLN